MKITGSTDSQNDSRQKSPRDQRQTERDYDSGLGRKDERIERQH